MKPFTTIAVALFTLMALVHLGRLFAGWEVVVAGFVVPSGGVRSVWSLPVGWP